MELGVLLLLLLCFAGLQAQTPAVEERRWEGSALRIQCAYPAQLTSLYLKSWCHMTDGQWSSLVEMPYDPYSQTKQFTKGHVTIEESQMHNTLSVIMTNLQAEDSGTYSCAYRHMYGSLYLPVKMISLNVFKEMHRWELESLSVQCPYNTVLPSLSAKAWCRRGPTGCRIWLKTNYPSTRSNNKTMEDRALIQDDIQKSTFTVTMQKLQARDAGMYWCALYRESQLTRLMEVRLSVSKRTQQYAATESGNLSVQCLYNASAYGAVSKAWCKEGARKPCTVLALTNSKPSGDRRTLQQDRVMIQDDVQEGVVTVTMGKLQAQDSGVYWCALYEAGQLFRMVEVTLSIPKASSGMTPSATPGTIQSTPPDYTSALSSKVKIFIILSGVLGILFILALISSVTLYIKWHKQLKRRGELIPIQTSDLARSKGNRDTQDMYEKPEDIAQLGSTERIENHNDDSKDLKYATLNFKSRLSPEDTLYCNIEPMRVHCKAREESMEYAIIALKHLPTNDKG